MSTHCAGTCVNASTKFNNFQLRLLTALPHLIEEGRGDWLVILAYVHQITHRGETQEMTWLEE